jgi:hypothetical protein
VKSDPPSASTALELRASDAPNVWDDVRLQKLWLGVERREWRSLSVLGASKSLETMPIAELLAQLAWRYRGEPSGVCDLRDLTMRLFDYGVQEMRTQIEAGMRLIIPLRSIFENPTSALIAKQTDAVLLCIALGETNFKAAEETIAAVGRERVVGSILLRPRKAGKKAKPTNGGR